MTETQPGPRHATPAPWAPPAGRGVHWNQAPGHAPAGLAPAWAGMPPAAPPRRPRWGWIVLGIVGVIAALGLVGTLVVANQPMTVQGSVTVYGMNGVVSPGSSCSNTYLTGRPVSIFGADGSLVGTSSITGYGTAVNQWSTYSSGYADACVYSFTVADVPAGEKSYRVTLGTDISNSVGFTEDQLSRGAHITMGH
ncbi:hypothetical protein [Actinomycetospora termitidis]|uniref:Uncharacterized protein n=1 Tax=Actinomycetospora termitidis TaxID=3053470 RepID=A0ABT7MGD0_9PSEU|nr:hypothetical protein [Actinomycetospora sp. Odt1-22]MDL5158927.1 hypothetical protein [Actinomycetospora sp. Odt1-22]